MLQPCVISSDRPVLQLHVTGQFYLDSKGKYILKVWGRANPKDTKRREAPGPILAPLFICFFLLFLSPPCVNWASQEGCMFYLRFSLQSWTFLYSIFMGFPLLCLLTTAILDSFFLFYLTFPFKRCEAWFFGNRGVEVSLTTSCWTGMVRGIGPPSLASLKPQSPYLGVHLRVSGIFCGQL